jgi:capsular polysaccharide transport system permease protein
VRGSFEFFAIGYVLFMQLRQMITRAGSTIPSNSALLFHRQVTLPDLFYARHMIETASCVGVLGVFTFAAVALGGEYPDAPMKMLAAAGMMFLLGQGVAMMMGALTSEWHGVERAIHVLTYLLMPISGVFFMVDWLPEWLQDIVYWVPTVHVFELLRDGQFGDRVRATYDLSYVTIWILSTHLIGLAGLRLARERIGLE